MDVDPETEIETDDENTSKGTEWHDNLSNPDPLVTLNLNVFDHEDYSDSNCSSDLIIATNEVAEKPISRRRKRRKTGIGFEGEIPKVFKDMEDEIERQLDAKAAKTNLTVINVKNILKSVITNEDVMAMVRHSIQIGEDKNWLTYEPKLTRAKAKELMQKQPDIPLTLYTPTKKQSECQILIDKELSEDSSDDEYKPVEDDQSEDEKSSMADSISSPIKKIYTPVPLTYEFNSAESSARDGEMVANVECGTQTCWSEDGLFKVPNPRPEISEKEEENIGQRTRSKLSLNNTPLEVIENAFIPPDITTDMYDSDCDDEDWKSFLKDFALNQGESENIDDDDMADPEYNVLADFEVQSIDEEDFRVDKAVKISRKEKKVLMAEAYEPLFSDDEDFVLQQFFPLVENSEPQITQNVPEIVDAAPEPSEPIHNNSPEHINSCYNASTPHRCQDRILPAEPEMADSSYHEPLSPPPSPHENDIPEILPTQLAIFKQQMRQHVQILTQNFLQTYSHPTIGHYAEKFKSLLANLKCLSLNKIHSNFESENLNEAIDLIENWEKRLKDHPEERERIEVFFMREAALGKSFRKRKCFYQEKLPKEIMEIIVESKVFLYPLLLPDAAFRTSVTEYVPINSGEEHLIALGLEQFMPYVKERKKQSTEKTIRDVIYLIHQNMLTHKNYNKTRNYIADSKSKKKPTAVKYYLNHGKAPETTHYVFPVDWENVKCPKDQPPEFLPKSWAKFVHGISQKDKNIPRRVKRERRSWSRKYAIPLLILGDFPDEKTARSFAEGTLDYSLITGRVFKMLPSMPLISNVSKDIVECSTSMSSKLPNVIFSLESVDRSTQTKKSSPLKTVNPILKKYNSHRKGKGGASHNNSSATKGNEADHGKPAPRNIAPKPVVVMVPTEEINFHEITHSAMESTVNAQERIEENIVVLNEVATEKDTSNQNAQKDLSMPNFSEKNNENKDNEDELAALMIASSTIRVPGASLERKRKSKQQRDTDANLALLSPEKTATLEERDNNYAHAFFTKVRDRLDNGKTENNPWLNFFLTLNDLGIYKSKIDEDRTNEENEELIGRLLTALHPHKDLVEEFSSFLNSKQSLHLGCLASHLEAVQMRDFMHKIEVYFAKQPNHIGKIFDIISSLTNKPNVTIEDIKEDLVPLLKGNSILLNKLLQLMPDERPPESLMTDFEDLEFWDDVCEEEPVEVIRLPDREPDDRFGGEGCACSCHSSPSPDAQQGEKDACKSTHCNRCGLKFVNGRVVLQTAKGIRPARVIFDSPADLHRLVVKDNAMPPSRVVKRRARKKNKVNDNKDESSSPPLKIRLMHGTESEDEVGAVKSSELMNSPRGQPRSTGKGARTPVSKGKDSKIVSISHKSVAIENNQAAEKMDCSNGTGSSGTNGKSTLSSSSCSTSPHEERIASVSKNTHPEKSTNKPDSHQAADEENLESRQSTVNSAEESENKNMHNSNESKNLTEVHKEIQWTREEDRIILQTFQLDGEKSDTLAKIRQKLPERSVAEIASRFQKLMNLFRKMTGPTAVSSELDVVETEKRNNRKSQAT